ncbi:MAG: cyclic nucleotide-binding domain-containing protein [Elusimicrobia bacterium]|nr:cyclic nucleotide-binding domain-containing protein [Elusimicrobiota bacterium]
MSDQDKLKLLKSLRLLERIPQDKLSALGDFLEPQTFKDGAVVFDEGSVGDSLFFVSSGCIRIMKKVKEADGGTAYKDLAVLHPGDCFGEMVLFDESAARSARAAASGESVVLKLERKQLVRWLESNPSLAVGFFTELVQVLSQRLRRSSNEQTLLFDLTQWLLEPVQSGKELLKKVLSHLVPHMEGTWTAGAYLYNEFNDEMDLVASEGSFSDDKVEMPRSSDSTWIDEKNYLIPFPGKKKLQGYLIFRTANPLPPQEKAEISRTLTTAARLIASSLENINFRTEDSLRSRLAESKRYAQGI